jgi:hypothetical protein
MLMVPVPLALLVLMVVLLLLHAASADNAVTPAAAIRRLDRERPDKDLADKRELAGGRLAGAGIRGHGAVSRAAICLVLVVFVRCPDLIGAHPSEETAYGGGRPFRPAVPAERRDHGVVVTTA